MPEIGSLFMYQTTPSRKMSVISSGDTWDFAEIRTGNLLNQAEWEGEISYPDPHLKIPKIVVDERLDAPMTTNNSGSTV